MNKFKFKYSVTVYVLLILTLALSVVGLVWNIFNAVHFAQSETFKFVSSCIISVVTAALIVFVSSVLFYGKYVIKNGYLYTYFGFLKSKTPVLDVIEITHFKKSNKLVVYFKTNEYTVIVIAPEQYDDFILAMRKVNKNIVYDARIDGEDTPE